MKTPPVVPDNAKPSDLGPEPEGFWAPVHKQVAAWVAKYTEATDDDAG